MRRPHLIAQSLLTLLLVIAALTTICAQSEAAPEPLLLDSLTLSAHATLGEVTVTYHITPTNRSADAGMQIFVHRDDVTGHSQWDEIQPKTPAGSPLILNLYKGMDNTGSFTLALPRGVYGLCRVLLFDSPDGSSIDYGHMIYDSTVTDHRTVNLGVSIKTDAVPTHAPHLVLSGPPDAVPSGTGLWTVTIPVEVRYPTDYSVQEHGFWVMAKGGAGFAQAWADQAQAKPSGSADDPYLSIPVSLTIKNVNPGLWTTELGLFKYSFGEALQWLWPGVDFEIGGGSWVQNAPASKLPPRLRVKGGRFVTLDGAPFDFYSSSAAARRSARFVRGGNFGNAICWTIRPELSKPGYFILLQEMGCRFMRVNFNADRYPEGLYQHAVDQVVQNMWAAGLYPILAPQDLPQGASLEERREKGLRVVKAMANKYKGRPIWLEVLNEPHDFSSWAAWKPVAIAYAKAIREIDPNAFVIVPFEGFSKDSRAAAASPLPAGLVDLYDGHAYVNPSQVQTLFGPAAKAGLPLLIGEYGGPPAYLERMVKSLEAMSPPPLAAAPWAFTIMGQDQLPLVADGSTAVLKYTAAGKVIARAYAAWDSGKKLDVGGK